MDHRVGQNTPFGRACKQAAETASPPPLIRCSGGLSAQEECSFHRRLHAVGGTQAWCHESRFREVDPQDQCGTGPRHQPCHARLVPAPVQPHSRFGAGHLFTTTTTTTTHRGWCAGAFPPGPAYLLQSWRFLPRGGGVQKPPSHSPRESSRRGLQESSPL